MVDHDAAILDDVDSGFSQAMGRWTMVDSELHPDGLGAGVEREDLVDMSGNMLGCPKEVHDIDRFADRGEVPMASLIQHAVELGIDGNDAITRLLAYTREPERRPQKADP